MHQQMLWDLFCLFSQLRVNPLLVIRRQYKIVPRTIQTSVYLGSVVLERQAFKQTLFLKKTKTKTKTKRQQNSGMSSQNVNTWGLHRESSILVRLRAQKLRLPLSNRWKLLLTKSQTTVPLVPKAENEVLEMVFQKDACWCSSSFLGDRVPNACCEWQRKKLARHGEVNAFKL